MESKRTTPRPKGKREGQPQGLSFSFWSKCGDSNSRPPVPETGALPTALHLEILFYKEIYHGGLYTPLWAHRNRRASRLLLCRKSSPRYTRLDLLATRDIASPKTTLSCFRLALHLLYTSKILSKYLLKKHLKKPSNAVKIIVLKSPKMQSNNRT